MTVTASCLLFWHNGWILGDQHKASPESTSMAGEMISLAAPSKKSVLLLDYEHKWQDKAWSNLQTVL